MLKPEISESHRVERFSQIIGRTRLIVLFAVIAVMLVAVSLFLLGTIKAVSSVWGAWQDLFNGGIHSKQMTVEFLGIVSEMLKAVVFYIIGVGLYSLFISPLNITVSLGVQTLNDLESKIISVVVVILGVTFLEHFIRWEDPLATLQFGGGMALVVGALVLFQHFTHLAKGDQQENEHARAREHMFQQKDEQAEVLTDGNRRKAELPVK